MAAKLSPIDLINYIVFNSKFGPKEGQEAERILYYYPADIGLDTKIRNVGLCEGIIKFSSTFTDSPTDAVHTQKTRQLFYQPEPDFWMTMTVTVPYLERTVNGRTFKDYQEDEIQDSVYQALLVQTYQSFRLFNGSMNYIFAKADKAGLIQRLSHFFDKYLTTLLVGRIGAVETFNGVQYLPLDKHSYARVQSFLNQLKSVLPQISYSRPILLHNDQQIWSDLNQEDTRIMYNYLSTSLLPAAIAQELKISNISEGRFVIGPSNLSDETSVGRIPKIHVTDNGEDVQCHLVIYRVTGTTLCLLINGEHQLSFDFLRTLGHYCSKRLTKTSADIIEHAPRKSTSTVEVQHKYIYFNHMNMAVKATMCLNGRKSAYSVPDNITKLIGNIYDNFRGLSEMDDGEIIAKLSNDCWVIGKKSDQREVYIMVSMKNGNLSDISEEVKKICVANFSNIFFQD